MSISDITLEVNGQIITFQKVVSMVMETNKRGSFGEQNQSVSKEFR